MAFTTLLARRAEIRHRPAGYTTLTCAVVFVLGMAGLAGCGGSSGGSDGNNNGVLGPPPSSPSPSSSCFFSSLVHPGHKPGTAKLPVLLSARNPTFIPIPEPEVNAFEPRPAGDDPQEQSAWADQGVQSGDTNRIQLPGNDLEMNQETLQQESNAVAFKEDLTLVSDDQTSGDRYYGIRMCLAIHAVLSSFDSLDNLQQVVDTLNNLASSYQPSSNDLANVIVDATQQFQSAFGGCIDDLQVARWILEQVHKLFCYYQD